MFPKTKSQRTVTLAFALFTVLAASGVDDPEAAAQQSSAETNRPIDQIDVIGTGQDPYRIAETSIATTTLTPLLNIPQSPTLISGGLIR